MIKASLLIIVLVTILAFVSFRDPGVEGAMGLDNVHKKRYETDSKVVLKRADQGISLLRHEASVSFEETCKLHRLIQRKISNEHRANTDRDTHRRRNGVNCPASTERISASK
tara:strand:+ start:170 stop:505 length:336 start_codon:yes stop_codon:yes gene_type:complete